MADSVNVTNFPDSGSPARVAWEMTKYLRSSIQGETTADKIEGYLDLYARCYEATSGRRLPSE